MTGYLGLVLDAHGLHLERGVQAWQITRPERWGIVLGVVWGPLRRPVGARGANPWTQEARWTLRMSWAILPWLSAWRWREPRSDHPARLYLGGKVFFVDEKPADIWARPEERGRWFVCPSASLRSGCPERKPDDSD